MIAARGGIDRLGLPDLTIQMMVWYDALMAAESGTKPYFSDIMSDLAKKGIASFNPQEAVMVANVSSPQRYDHPGYSTEHSIDAKPPPRLVELAE